MEITIELIETVFSQQLRSLPLKGGGKNGKYIFGGGHANFGGKR